MDIRYNFEVPNVHVEYFIGGETNVCFNALDKHIAEGRGDKPALIWEQNNPELETRFTFSELHKEVNHGVLVG